MVTRPGAALGPDELIAWARERLANYKVPRFVEVVTELPRNASGKVRKGDLRAQGPQRALAQHPGPDLPSDAG